MRRTFRVDHENVAVSYGTLANFCGQSRGLEDTIDYVIKAVSIFGKTLVAEHLHIAQTQGILVDLQEE